MTGGPGPLEGRAALVTGGGGAIGSVIAKELLCDLGASVVVASRRLQVLEEVCAHSRRMVPLELDVTDPQAWERAAAFLAAEIGAVSVVVPCAGFTRRALFLDSQSADWDTMWRTNVVGTMAAVRVVLPGMLTQEWGRIILVSSAAAVVGLRERTVYCATKAAVEGFARALAVEVAGSGVTVNTLAPGPIRTPINAEFLRDGSTAQRETLAAIPEGRFGNLQELGAAVRYLLEAGYSQGAVVRIDGGWTIAG